MSSLDPKTCIFLTSTGRTGTQLFGYAMSRMIEGSTSVHEPDHLWLSRPGEWWPKVKRFGIYRMTLGQLDPETSLNMLTADRIRGKVSDESAKEHLFTIRNNVIAGCTETIYIEANPQYIGLIDLIPRVFEGARIVLIIRDPRTWIRSTINAPLYLQYSPLDFRMWLNLRVRPTDLAGDPHAAEWKRMSTFERRCWYWNLANRFALGAAERTHNCLVLRYEDLFSTESAGTTFSKLLSLCTESGDKRVKYQFRPELIERKVHSTSDKGSFPPWQSWDEHRARLLDRHCGTLMARFNYGQEEEWLRLIGA